MFCFTIFFYHKLIITKTDSKKCDSNLMPKVKVL